MSRSLEAIEINFKKNYLNDNNNISELAAAAFSAAYATFSATYAAFSATYAASRLLVSCPILGVCSKFANMSLSGHTQIVIDLDLEAVAITRSRQKRGPPETLAGPKQMMIHWLSEEKKQVILGFLVMVSQLVRIE